MGSGGAAPERPTTAGRIGCILDFTLPRRVFVNSLLVDGGNGSRIGLLMCY